MKTLLLTGASGFLGYNFLQLDLNEWNVVALVNHKELKNPNVKHIACDISDLVSLRSVFNEILPNAVIHLSAVSNANSCEENVQSTYQVNVSASVCLAKLCAHRNVPFLFTSTDLVFNGYKGNYAETDTTEPLMAYGKQKAEAEQLILAKHENACVLRMPLMFGAGGSFLLQDMAKLKSGQSINLFTDEYRSVVGGISAAKGIKLALDNNWKGIYHLGGKEKISRYDFGLLICQTFGFDESLVIPRLQSEVKMAAPRPKDVTLNSEKAYHLGYAPLDVSDELKSLKGIIQF